MKVFCNQKDLLKGLVIASKAISSNNTLPILNNILIKAEGQKLYFSATNLEIAIEYFIEAEVKNEGIITVPAKIFTNYINFLKDEKIEITSKESNLLIHSSLSETEINSLPSSDFPSIPKIEQNLSFKIKKEDFKKAIKQVVFAASNSNTRPVLSGVFLNLIEDKLKLVATDSYRLSEKTIPVLKVEKNFPEIKSIIPAKTISELLKLIELEEEINEVEVINSNNQILFKIGNIILTSRLIEGIYPDYQQIIPKECKTTIELSLEELILTLKRINLFAKENNNSIKLKIEKNGNLEISTTLTQIGSDKSVLKTKTQGEENIIALNSQYLLEILLNIENEDKVLLQLNERINPIILKIKEQPDFIHVIMPLKI